MYNDHLYIGEYNDEEIALERILFAKTGKNANGQFGGGLDCRFINANLEQSVNLYRMDRDENMELVVGNATRMFPNGSLSGLGSGFGRSENQYIWRMQVYDDKLYVGTFDTSSMLECVGQFVNGNLLTRTPAQWKTQWDYLKALMKALQETDPDGNGNPDTLAQTIKFSYKFVFKNITVSNIASAIRLLNYMRKAKQGFDLYVSEDGVNFQTITVDGFGDPYNHGLRVFATTDQGLCLALPIPSTARRCGSGARTADPRTSRITAARLSNEPGVFCVLHKKPIIFLVLMLPETDILHRGRTIMALV